jgi:AraC-like DNA-binding protein
MKPIYAKPPAGSRAAFQVRKDYFEHLDTRWHYHTEYELAYINYAKGKRLAGNSIQTFEGTDLVFYGPNLPHAWVNDGDIQLGVSKEKFAVVVHFSADCFGQTFFGIPEMYAITNVLEKSKKGLLIEGKSKERIINWMNEMVDHTNANRVILLLQILQELATSNSCSILSSAGYWTNLNDHDSVRMGQIYEYLVQNYTNDIQLEAIAAHANISPSAFCRYFKARTKKTLKEFVNDLRINHACKMLEENKLAITQISFEAGFNNISNFNRRFKEIKGITPQQYKANILGLYNRNKAFLSGQ